MTSSTKTLFSAGIVFAVLVVIVSVLSIVTANQQIDIMPEDTPEGAVQRYLIAISEDRWEDAYSYLQISPEDRVTSYEEWYNMAIGWSGTSRTNTWKASLGSSVTEAGKAHVGVIIETFSSRGAFNDPISSQDLAFTLTLDNGKWWITSPIYVFWY